MSLYEINELKRVYGTRTVLDIPHLTIEEHKIHALLGANGAGKTTLLNLLAFLDTPTSGTISFRSHQVQFAEKNLRALRRQAIMVDQQPLLFTTSVFKNLEFGLEIRSIPKSERRRGIETALDLVGMRHFINSPAHNLSGGETKRVALARALVLKPKVLLCDEPTANVDEAHRSAIIDLLRHLNKKEGMSILFTTHHRNVATALAHNTIYLDEGSLRKEGEGNILPAFLEKKSAAAGSLGLRLKTVGFVSLQSREAISR